MTAAPRIAIVVTDVRQVTPHVKRFRLQAPDGALLPPFGGGAHIVVEMHDGPVVRRNAYSLMSSPTDTSFYEISVRRDDHGRGGSRYMHDKVSVGSELQIGYPVNLFPVSSLARKHLLIAGGIGITPFLPMIEYLAERRAKFEMHYAARSRLEAAYADELEHRYAGHIKLYDSEKSERLAIRPLLSTQPIGTHVYVCGPARLIEEVQATADDIGWPVQCVHAERFLAPVSGQPYDIYLKRSDKKIHVGADQSMLEAIEAAGVDAPYLCRGGACGQCETDVVACDGVIQHHDHFLSNADKASMKKVMPCVSRFEGRLLVLDL